MRSKVVFSILEMSESNFYTSAMYLKINTNIEFRELSMINKYSLAPGYPILVLQACLCMDYYPPVTRNLTNPENSVYYLMWDTLKKNHPNSTNKLVNK